MKHEHKFEATFTIKSSTIEGGIIAKCSCGESVYITYEVPEMKEIYRKRKAKQ